MIAAAPAAAAGVTIVQNTNTNGCFGDRPTPGSQNTQKILIGGTLVPGGTAIFQVTFPFTPGGDNGTPGFTIRDCIFINGFAIARYTITSVPSDVSPFVFEITVRIPAGADLGGLFCNVAKTIMGPSAAQGSNRKAGPACFRIGGDIRIVKVAAGDESQAPLAGASFDVSCVTPTGEETIPPVVISGLTGPDSSTRFVGGAYVSSGVATTGEIAIAGPIGTVCTVTETDPPPGFDLADPGTHDRRGAGDRGVRGPACQERDLDQHRRDVRHGGRCDHRHRDVVRGN